MAFVKLVKNNAYFKRYQTKYRRRREGKTDYYARRRFIYQDKDKYNTPKYRFVARITSGKVICQIIYATIKGDKVLCQANSKEFEKHGLKAGFTNYAASYATGLLLARRLLKNLKMEEYYKGIDKANGEMFRVGDNPNEERRPFRAILDSGLVNTTTGNRVFGAMKGAVDGGIDIPHSETRFPGFFKAEEEGDKDIYEAGVHRDRIYGVHIDNYMKHLKEEGGEAYKKQFSKWDETLKSAKVDSVEKLFTKIHDAVKKDPNFTKKSRKDVKKVDRKIKRLNKKQKKENALKRIQIRLGELK